MYLFTYLYLLLLFSFEAQVILSCVYILSAPAFGVVARNVAYSCRLCLNQLAISVVRAESFLQPHLLPC